MAAVFALGAFVTTSCLSPTLPLPPPEAPDALHAAATPGVWLVSGTCTPGARVTVLNEATGRGAVFEDRDSTGRYVVDVEATRCEIGSVTQSFTDDPESASTSSRFIFQETTSGTPADPAECH